MTTHLRTAPRARAGWLPALGFLVLSVIPIIGPPGELGWALLLGAVWTIYLAVAEWAVRRQTPARALVIAQGGAA